MTDDIGRRGGGHIHSDAAESPMSKITDRLRAFVDNQMSCELHVLDELISALFAEMLRVSEERKVRAKDDWNEGGW